MRSIHEEVIRIICGNREWMRKYPIKLALVNNPKTRWRASMAMIKGINMRDLKAISAVDLQSPPRSKAQPSVCYLSSASNSLVVGFEGGDELLDPVKVPIEGAQHGPIAQRGEGVDQVGVGCVALSSSASSTSSRRPMRRARGAPRAAPWR